MEVKPGYKQTEVGVIPEEWEVTLFDELFTFRNGVNADKSSYGQGVRFVNVLEPITYSHIYGPEITGQVMLPEPVATSYAVRRGDVLFNRTSETQEEVGLASTYLGTERVVFGGFVIRGRPTDQSLDPIYSGYALRAPIIRSQIIPMGQGAIRANIGQQNLSLVVAPIPPLPEQRAIAEALSDVDALIESLEQLIAKRRNLKQGAMQELLTGKRRLPRFSGSGEWEVVPLGQCLRRAPTYGVNAPAVSLDSRFPTYLRITDITEDGRFAEATKVSVNHPATESYMLEPGDIVFARTGASVGKSYLYNQKDGSLVFAGFLIRISPNPECLDPSFLSFYAQSSTYWNWVKVNSMRSGQPGINGREYANLPIPLPPTKDEQTAIAAILSDMDAEIAALEARRDKTLALKEGMMQELLTGRIRLV